MEVYYMYMFTQIVSVVLELGSPGQRCAILQWRGAGGDVMTVNGQGYYRPKTRVPLNDTMAWEQVESSALTRYIVHVYFYLCT